MQRDNLGFGSEEGHHVLLSKGLCLQVGGDVREVILNKKTCLTMLVGEAGSRPFHSFCRYFPPICILCIHCIGWISPLYVLYIMTNLMTKHPGTLYSVE